MPCVSKTKATSALCPRHREHTFSVQPFQWPGHRALLEGPVWVVGMQQCVPEGIRALWLTGDLLPDRPSDASVTRVISQALPSFLRWQGCKGLERGHRAQSHHLRSPDRLCLRGRSFLLSQKLLLAYHSLEEFWIPNILLLSSMQERARMVLGRS